MESPEWPRSYKGKTTCAWHLSVDPRETITLSFKRFSLDEDGTCKNAKLIVRDGSGENSEALGVYCGTKRPTGITSSGNHLFVQFTSTEGGKGKGFLISYNTGRKLMRSLAVRPCFYRVTFGLRASTVNRDCFAFDLSRNVTLPLLPIKYQT